MELVFKAAAVAVIGGLCSVAVRKQVPEFALVLALATAALLLHWSSALLSEGVTFLHSLGDMTGLSEDVLAPLFKAVAIGVVTKITVELCRDAGEQGIGAAVEFAGGVAAVSASIPLMQMVLASLQSLL